MRVKTRTPVVEKAIMLLLLLVLFTVLDASGQQATVFPRIAPGSSAST